MIIKFQSNFKDEKHDIAYFEKWVDKLETANGRNYQRIPIQTSLGKTHVWGLHTEDHNLEALVIFPGARSSALFWDLDKGLDNLKNKFRVFLVETNGLPNLSDGSTPDIKSLDYGHWAKEVMEKLDIDKAYVAGASFGGLICMKLAIVAPEKVKAAFLLNPGCLQPFSLSWNNLYYNILPIVSPTEKNVRKFLDKAVFCKPNHQLSEKAEQLLVDYEVFAISRYKDKTQKPYYMDKQLAHVKVPTYLLEGDKDLLFPYQKSIDNAKKHLPNLKAVKVFENVGHGIETYPDALKYLAAEISR
ncbi:MAG: alpha/beta hydrolase [Bacteroidetes bacterium]|nr:alpha/beta hydrolase [Bacteroidota bacterium]